MTPNPNTLTIHPISRRHRFQRLLPSNPLQIESRIFPPSPLANIFILPIGSTLDYCTRGGTLGGGSWILLTEFFAGLSCPVQEGFYDAGEFEEEDSDEEDVEGVGAVGEGECEC